MRIATLRRAVISMRLQYRKSHEKSTVVNVTPRGNQRIRGQEFVCPGLNTSDAQYVMHRLRSLHL